MHPHLATVALHNPEHRRQPQARALVTFGGEKGLEYLALYFGRHADAVVANFDPGLIMALRTTDVNGPVGWQGVDVNPDRRPLALGRVAPARRRQLDDLADEEGRVRSIGSVSRRGARVRRSRRLTVSPPSSASARRHDQRRYQLRGADRRLRRAERVMHHRGPPDHEPAALRPDDRPRDP